MTKLRDNVEHIMGCADGTDQIVTVTRATTFHNFDLGQEVSVSEGVICAVQIPDEIKSGADARSWAALLLEAADELERSQAGRDAMGEGK